MKSLETFSMRIGTFEVRTCSIHLMKNYPHVTMEIIKWVDVKTNYTLARWKRDSDGYDLRFVGSRPLTDCDSKTFFKLAIAGQEILDEYWEEE